MSRNCSVVIEAIDLVSSGAFGGSCAWACWHACCKVPHDLNKNNKPGKEMGKYLKQSWNNSRTTTLKNNYIYSQLSDRSVPWESWRVRAVAGESSNSCLSCQKSSGRGWDGGGSGTGCFTSAGGFSLTWDEGGAGGSVASGGVAGVSLLSATSGLGCSFGPSTLGILTGGWESGWEVATAEGTLKTSGVSSNFNGGFRLRGASSCGVSSGGTRGSSNLRWKIC